MRPALTRLFALCALGEMAVGGALLAFPSLIALLMGAALDGSALLLARMMGAAVLALGVTWWLARGDEAGLARCAAGFIVYNTGVGVLFGFAAVDAAHPLVPWIVCGAHLVAAAVFGAALAQRSTRRS
jgi:hypothetical protein